ncbi:permease [Barnesiella sp. WM24]|uniref:AEC family transporter n=1 Tax=Barnesiella sp. WM24 TaxID=2558278 RepID=UPI001072E8C9|nr:AEC family transporter [Barnesiella sp. WM24]TFU93130.1 permease [Barnesiella sp. WM24]
MGHIILYAIVPIFVIMALGYISGKKGAFSGADAKILNKVVLNYALPAALFVSIIKANREMLSVDLKLTVISFTVLIACFFLVYFVFKYLYKDTTAESAVSALISGSPTIGFLGFAVLQPIFGSSASVGLVIAIVAIEVNAVGIPIGLSLLNAGNEAAAAKNGGKKPNPWKPVIHALEQPVAWAPILAVILVLCGVKWPACLDPSFNLIAGANASVAVFAAGITLSSVKIVLNGQVFMGSFLKLIVMPLAILIVGLLFHMEPFNLKMLVVCAALPPAFSGIIIASRYNTYVATGTSSLAVSTLLFMGACPLWIWLTDLALKWWA